jgi:cytidine deaminase
MKKAVYSDRELMELAIEARKYAYAPYSGELVGAALLSEDGEVFKGCNIENAAYSPSNCAERTAVFKAVSSGVRSFLAIAVAGGRGGSVSGMYPPCGVCRQVLREFCPDPSKFRIILGKPDDLRIFTLEELLPESFGPENLE